MVKEVEHLTRGQRSNPLWSTFRTGRLTASKFGDVLRACRRKTIPPSLVSSLLGEYNLEGVKAVQWGVEHEKDAIEKYRTTFGKTVSPTGLLLHESGVLAASPDGFIHPDGLLEVKCPFSFSRQTIPEVLENKNFYIILDDTDTYILNPKHTYYDQCQGQLHISGRDKLDFFVWLSPNSTGTSSS